MYRVYNNYGPYHPKNLIMKKPILTILLALSAYAASAAGLTFSGSQSVDIQPDKSTGLDCIYVLENSANATATYTAASSSATVRWYKFGNSGGAYAVEIPCTVSGLQRSVNVGPDDTGYIIEEGDRRAYYWVTNYANHPFDINGLDIAAADTDCLSVALAPQGQGDRMVYYTINGASKEIDRQITVSYNTLVYDRDSEYFAQSAVNQSFAYLSPLMRVEAPLCDTAFRLSGDRFLRAWGRDEAVESAYYHTKAISAETTAVQTERDNDNESGSNTGGLGGSAPVEITFNAAITDAVRFTEWQFAADPNFDNIDLRFNQTELTYTFKEYGTTYVRFVASNNDGDCDVYGPTYQVDVGESKLLCPNAFSPGSSEGVNDEWKVSYKSIISFECHIFNRWGTKIITLTDPSQGWDGRYKGKLVPAGVYYYVIKAVGSDGHKYNLSGDINIVNHRAYSSPSQPVE